MDAAVKAEPLHCGLQSGLWPVGFCGGILGFHPKHWCLVADRVVEEASGKTAIIKKSGPSLFSENQVSSWTLMIQWGQGASL